MASPPPAAALLGETGREGSERGASALVPSDGTSQRPGAGLDPGPRSEHRADVLADRSECSGRDRKRHTSELQSRFDLVCRLLLEKNNSSDPLERHAMAIR